MVTAVKAAKHICLGPARFRDLIEMGVFERMPPGKYDLTTVREAYCLHAQKVMAGREDSGGGLSKQRVRLEAAKTEAVEFRNATAKGDYVRLSVVSKVGEALFTNMREIALGVPGKISDMLSAYCEEDRTQIFNIVHEEICAMLEMLSVTEVISGARDQRMR